MVVKVLYVGYSTYTTIKIVNLHYSSSNFWRVLGYFDARLLDSMLDMHTGVGQEEI